VHGKVLRHRRIDLLPIRPQRGRSEGHETPLEVVLRRSEMTNGGIFSPITFRDDKIFQFVLTFSPEESLSRRVKATLLASFLFPSHADHTTRQICSAETLGHVPYAGERPDTAAPGARPTGIGRG
jgi:phage terminase large subunit-like protein